MTEPTSRTRVTVILSSRDFPYHDVLAFIAPRLSQHFAGATCRPIDGIWSEDGDQFLERYQPGVIEPGIQIMVTVLPSLEAAARSIIESLVREMKQSFDLPLEWVHLEVERTEAGHFRV